MQTRITELLGVKYPIIQGGMAWVAESTLAAAVSNAGGVWPRPHRLWRMVSNRLFCGDALMISITKARARARN